MCQGEVYAEVGGTSSMTFESILSYEKFIGDFLIGMGIVLFFPLARRIIV